MSSRVILITGANGALGQAIAEAFLAENAETSVWLGVHSRRDKADELAGRHPGRCRVTTLDVTSREAWQRVVNEIVSAESRLDVLINNAGVHDDALLGMMSPEAWETVRATNLDGVFHGCQAVLPAMIRERRGRIVNIASLSALLAPAGQSNYAAAKAGVVALTQSLAKEVARLNITVNVVCPGYVETEALRGWTAEERGAAQARVPMRRFGRPDEVAAAVRFLACADAGYITGSVLKIDGGIF